MTVHIFIPCFIDQLYPQVGFSMVKVLEKATCEVLYNTNQTCCGQPAFNAGHWNEAREVCSKFLKDFENADYIVCPSASCAGFVKNYYHKLFEGTAEAVKAALLSKKIFVYLILFFHQIFPLIFSIFIVNLDEISLPFKSV